MFVLQPWNVMRPWRWRLNLGCDLDGSGRRVARGDVMWLRDSSARHGFTHKLAIAVEGDCEHRSHGGVVDKVQWVTAMATNVQDADMI